MLGLVKKDLLLTVSNAKSLIIIFVLYFFMAFYGEFDISIIPSILGVMLVISTFSYDYQSKWDSYASTFPKGRKYVPLAKYIATFILMLGLTIITLIFSLLITYIKHEPFEVTTLLSMVVASLASFIFEAIMYPIIFKFGVEKARIAIFVFVFAFIFLINFLVMQTNMLSNLSPILTFIGNYYYIVLPLIGILALVISYIISVKIYMKKEF